MPPGRRVACIDIGSNTARLLVAEAGPGGLRELAAERAFTRLCAPGPDAAIPAERVRAVAEAVAGQAALARRHGAAEVRAVATAVIRRAPNGQELCEAVRLASGLTVDVLSGEEEARLAFAGATATLPEPPAGRVGVVDVGGGSTELVVGTAGAGVEWSTSLPVGSGLLTEAHLRSDPPGDAQLRALRAQIDRAFAGVDAPRPAAGYAVGGSATSLRRMVGEALDDGALAAALRDLLARPSAAVAARHGLARERARLLPAGIALLEAASRALRCPLRIALGGLREGVVLEQLARAER